MEFIWGLKSACDFTAREANLYTLNDIEIIYDSEEEVYWLGIETIYCFENTAERCDYLSFLLDAFTKFMLENNYSTDHHRLLDLDGYTARLNEASSIEELYFNFKLFVHGYHSLMDDEIRQEVEIENMLMTPKELMDEEKYRQNIRIWRNAWRRKQKEAKVLANACRKHKEHIAELRKENEQLRETLKLDEEERKL